MKRLIEWYRSWRHKRQQEAKQEQFLRRAGSTERCPHCKTWTWEVGGWAAVKQHHTDRCLDLMTCKQCGKDSSWLYGPGLFLLIDPNPEGAGHELDPN